MAGNAAGAIMAVLSDNKNIFSNATEQDVIEYIESMLVQLCAAAEVMNAADDAADTVPTGPFEDTSMFVHASEQEVNEFMESLLGQLRTAAEAKNLSQFANSIDYTTHIAEKLRARH